MHLPINKAQGCNKGGKEAAVTQEETEMLALQQEERQRNISQQPLHILIPRNLHLTLQAEADSIL